MIVDVHVHHRWIRPQDPPWTELEETFAAAELCGIDRLGFLGSGSGHGVDPRPEDIRDCNTHGARIVDVYGDRAFSLCYLNPAHDPSFIAEELDRCVLDLGMRGIKQWIAVNARDPRMDAVMQGAIRHSIPVFFHAWYKTVGRVYNESSPADIRDLALRYPQATIVMLHLIGGKERGVLDIKDLPNVYVDTSGSQPEAGFVEFAVRHLGPERILYGSDAPGRDFSPQLAKVTGAQISAEAKEMILGKNAERLLQLAP